MAVIGPEVVLRRPEGLPVVEEDKRRLGTLRGHIHESCWPSQQGIHESALIFTWVNSRWCRSQFPVRKSRTAVSMRSRKSGAELKKGSSRIWTGTRGLQPNVLRDKKRHIGLVEPRLVEHCWALNFKPLRMWNANVDTNFAAVFDAGLLHEGIAHEEGSVEGRVDEEGEGSLHAAALVADRRRSVLPPPADACLALGRLAEGMFQRPFETRLEPRPFPPFSEIQVTGKRQFKM